MIIGYVILGLFVLTFVGVLCGWIKVRLEYEREASKNENYAETYEALKKRNTTILLSRICACCLAVIFITAVALVIVNGQTADEVEPTTVATTLETVPETEVGTTECTSAPVETTVETSVPETTEYIHIDPTPATEPQPTSAPVSGDNNTEEGMSELEMLACVIYQEAGGNGSCDNCRRYVADIVLNRVEHPGFPDTMYEVLTSKGQYGRFYWTGIKWAERAKYESEAFAVERAYKVAEEVLNGQHSELYGNGYIWQAGFVQGTDGFWCCGHFYGR